MRKRPRGRQSRAQRPDGSAAAKVFLFLNQKTIFSFSGSAHTEEEETAQEAPTAEVRKLNTT